jgi:hypothetical protein
MRYGEIEVVRRMEKLVSGKEGGLKGSAHHPDVEEVRRLGRGGGCCESRCVAEASPRASCSDVHRARGVQRGSCDALALGSGRVEAFCGPATRGRGRSVT